MNVGIIGRARSGKDTAGAWFVEQRGYQRVAFADELKAAALRVDPIVQAYDDREDWGDGDLRLSEAVRLDGWEAAKSNAEVRRFLQHLGASIRAIDPDFWLRAALAKADEANDAGKSTVITDVRYPNEAAALRARGWHLLHIERPGIPHLDHESEGALTAADADFTIVNDSDVPAYLRAVELVYGRIYEIESARHYGRSHS